MTPKRTMSFGSELKNSANEALSIAKGALLPAGVFVPKTVDVVAIRKRLRLSQTAFAEKFCLPVGLIRDWEHKKRSPDRAAVVLLTLIDRNPALIAQVLAEEQCKVGTEGMASSI